MSFEIRRERVAFGRSHAYFAYANGERITNATTKGECESKAFAILANAYKHLVNTSAVRIAKDGTVILVRQTGDDCAMVEYNRNGRTGSTCSGTMSNGVEKFRDVQAYADYLISQYDDSSEPQWKE